MESPHFVINTNKRDMDLHLGNAVIRALTCIFNYLNHLNDWTIVSMCDILEPKMKYSLICKLFMYDCQLVVFYWKIYTKICNQNNSVEFVIESRLLTTKKLLMTRGNTSWTGRQMFQWQNYLPWRSLVLKINVFLNLHLRE